MIATLVQGTDDMQLVKVRCVALKASQCGINAGTPEETKAVKKIAFITIGTIMDKVAVSAGFSVNNAASMFIGANIIRGIMVVTTG